MKYGKMLAAACAAALFLGGCKAVPVDPAGSDAGEIYDQTADQAENETSASEEDDRDVSGSAASENESESAVSENGSESDASNNGSESAVSESREESGGSAGDRKSSESPSEQDAAQSESDDAEEASKDKASGHDETAAGLEDHVQGIRDFTVIEGMNPDVMAGIFWDDQIGAVVCDPLQVSWDTPGDYDLSYVIAAIDAETIRTKTVHVTVYPDLDHYLYGMEGLKQVTVNGSFDPLEGVSWEDEILSVSADTGELDLTKQGEYPVTYTLSGKDGHIQTTTRRITVVEEGSAWSGDGSAVIDLGIWRLTAYRDTPEDQGIYVGKTASGAPLVAGRTVAVSAATMARLGLSFGDRLLIDGHVYILEDHGGSAMNDQNWADIFVNTPEEEYAERFNHYTQVYLLR